MFWIDTRHMSQEESTGALYTAVSRDGGETFNGDREIFASNVCPCCQLMATANGNSDVYVTLRGVTADNIRQSTVTRIASDGTVKSDKVDTRTAPWQINACPLKPTAIATRGDAVFTAVYGGGEDAPGVYFSSSMDGGHSFIRAVPAHAQAIVSDAPSVAANDQYVLLAWHGKTDGPRRVFYRMYDFTGLQVGEISHLDTGAQNASSPVVTVRAGQFQVAWEQADQIHTTVLPATPLGETKVGLR